MTTNPPAPKFTFAEIATHRARAYGLNGLEDLREILGLSASMPLESDEFVRPACDFLHLSVEILPGFVPGKLHRIEDLLAGPEELPLNTERLIASMLTHCSNDFLNAGLDMIDQIAGRPPQQVGKGYARCKYPPLPPYDEKPELLLVLASQFMHTTPRLGQGETLSEFKQQCIDSLKLALPAVAKVRFLAGRIESELERLAKPTPNTPSPRLICQIYAWLVATAILYKKA